MKTISLILFLLISIGCFGQENYFTDPVKIPLLLSGSFAELRSNHFHSGIDIKTQGTVGIPVYAVANGYISRIAVSPTGYGNALYINHTNGTTTVYGHLLHFSPAIDKYVKDKQYEQKSFRVDLQIPQYLFPVKQNDEIAKSGNSGSSGGPHLHFEIRDTKTEEPLNPLKYNFPVKDSIAPKIFSLLVVPLSDDSHVNFSTIQQSYPVVFYDGKYHLKNNPVIPAWGKIGVAVQTNDYFNGTYNKCGINLLRMTLDDETQFMFRLNRFSFDNSRYINSHIVYDEYVTSKRRFQKTWLEPGNKLPIYNHNGSRGIISPEPDKTQQVEIELQDTYGNTSVIAFSMKGSFKNVQINSNESQRLFKYNKENQFNTDDIEMLIPKNALYKDFNFFYSKKNAPAEFYSEYHIVHNNTVPLHKNIDLRVKAKNLPRELEPKAILANIDTTTGEFYAAGGKFKNGWVETKTSNFGTYAVVVDTIAPTIIPLSIKANALTETNRIRFKIQDDLAGIETIEGILDGKWALFEYDPKNNRITHYFDKTRFEFNRQHHLKLTVTDYRGNSAVYEVNFWK
ncbi:M23 family metallopeptidase [Prolixibacteraceae bacterium Z1-6]|uniref:M23 family metallopeptidase n=1 Tax=Draconibacterium aestuarii TaxID=2998507 RepID=A0A9X3F9P7_9BACT|nr:M23 family metallopeptidase [Prolixibacteraceae bacterium Z1-6]